ncbi:MAG: hypothetical protein AAF614_15550 [Chloroflexota bacterium]
MEETPPQKTIIAADQRLSQSIVWEIQRHYFLQNGMKAWQEDVVPHQISCSPVMARSYSQLVFGYLRDCFAAWQAGTFELYLAEPLYIVELGAGSGRLLYHFLHQFYPLFEESPFAELPIKFVLTDFVPSIIEFWQGHEKLQPWVEAGLLDFGLFDVMKPEPLRLRNSQATLTADSVINPIILFANYFFDSIPQDSFVQEDGLLCENLLTVLSSQPEPDLADPTIWERLEWAYEPIPLGETYYEEPLYNEILASYEAQLPDTVLTFPNVGLDCVRFWQEVANGRLLLLSSDRGHTLADSLLDQEDPLPNRHGSFSLMVNYHAIGEYVWQSGGEVLHAPHYQDNLQTVAYLLGEVPQGGKETRMAFETAVIQGGPDDFFALKQSVEPQIAQLTLPQLLSFLRLSAWDADLFQVCLPALLAHVEQASPAWYPDIADVVAQVWRQYLPLKAPDPLEEQVHQLLERLGEST